ncbi:hypothetical protein M405DRAFT_923081 [Rhizopogon salebrosus TDB-379]|nr:hypothetical protein M405DRAFT_923081 [Rhizopogon salebrosus TDB-379]
MFSCSARCGPRRRDWLGSDVTLSKSPGYTAGWARGSEFARSSKVSWIRLPAISHGCTRSIPSQMRAPRQIASSSRIHLHLQFRISTSPETRNWGCFGAPVHF